MVADDEGLRPFETDAYISRRATPLVAVLPEREEQVREVLRAGRRLHVPVVTRGAGTGISGGAIPLPDGRPGSDPTMRSSRCESRQARPG